MQRLVGAMVFMRFPFWASFKTGQFEGYGSALRAATEVELNNIQTS